MHALHTLSRESVLSRQYEELSFPCYNPAFADNVFRLHCLGARNNKHIRIFSRGNPADDTVETKVLRHVDRCHLNCLYRIKSAPYRLLDDPFHVPSFHQINGLDTVAHQDEPSQVSSGILYLGDGSKITPYAPLSYHDTHTQTQSLKDLVGIDGLMTRRYARYQVCHELLPFGPGRVSFQSCPSLKGLLKDRQIPVRFLNNPLPIGLAQADDLIPG